MLFSLLLLIWNLCVSELFLELVVLAFFPEDNRFVLVSRIKAYEVFF